MRNWKHPALLRCTRNTASSLFVFAGDFLLYFRGRLHSPSLSRLTTTFKSLFFPTSVSHFSHFTSRRQVVFHGRGRHSRLKYKIRYPSEKPGHKNLDPTLPNELALKNILKHGQFVEDSSMAKLWTSVKRPRLYIDIHGQTQNPLCDAFM